MTSNRRLIEDFLSIGPAGRLVGQHRLDVVHHDLWNQRARTVDVADLPCLVHQEDLERDGIGR